MVTPSHRQHSLESYFQFQPHEHPFVVVGRSFDLARPCLMDDLCEGYEEDALIIRRDDLKDLLPAMPGKKFYLRTSTVSIFDQAVTFNFVNFLYEKFSLSSESQETYEALTFCLHEVLANAAMHGNLGLSSLDRSNFTHISDQINQYLNMPAYAKLAVTTLAYLDKGMLTIKVQDQGTWITPNDDTPSSDASVFGRGFSLIETLCASVHIDKDRSLITLMFPIV